MNFIPYYVYMYICCTVEINSTTTTTPTDYLGGCAKWETLCHRDEVHWDFGSLVSLLRRVFGPWVTVASLYAEFYSRRMESVGETLAEYSTALIRLHQRLEGTGPKFAERQALVTALRSTSLLSVYGMSGCDMS